MQGSEVLEEAFNRIPGIVVPAVDGLDRRSLAWRVDPDANSIGWLVWHLTRVQDNHVAELAELEQVWASEDWAPRFGLPPDTMETGFGHTTEQVAAVQPDGPDTLVGYLERVTEHTRTFLATIDTDDLGRIVDTSWDPPVTMGVRLVSVIDDGLQHAGQAAYLRGVHDRTVGG